MKPLEYIRIIKNKIIKVSKVIFYITLWIMVSILWQVFGPWDYSSEAYAQHCEDQHEQAYLEKLELEE